jgi:class 3 adenylate cyclase
VTLRAEEGGWPEGESGIATSATLHLVNATDREQLFILERTAWSDQAVTAAEVTGLQTFRDLFSREALRPDRQFSVGSLTIAFTDLRGSTRLYSEIGDAPAFGRVISHFDVLREAIVAEDGVLIKTIGDAVMAVFTRPAAAVRAMLRAQGELLHSSDGEVPLFLKVGIHSGACIAVTLNERLDYFGTAVNIAARAESLSTGHDLILTDAVRCDPEVEALLDEVEAPNSELFEAALKGFDDHFRLWRVTPLHAGMENATVGGV